MHKYDRTRRGFRIRLVGQHDNKSGVFTVTSPDLPGLVLTHERLDELLELVPEAIAIALKQRFGQDLEIVELHSPVEQIPGGLPDWAAIPAHVISTVNGGASAGGDDD
ncbi:MAG: hypothetical protein FJX42_10065 [Alphaproteobacteria bacterium]|nr:hypothetical protein [Alphaproteobacteria bacterium]